MRRVMLVIGLGLGVMSAACYDSYGYRRGYYGRGYYGGRYGGAYNNSGVVYTQPAPVQQQVVVGQPQPVGFQTPAMAGEGIAGSDGTRGWRVTVQAPDQEFQRIVGLASRASCQVEASTQAELRAVCGANVHVVLRFDQQNVYKLCGPGTDPGVCAQVWSSLGQ